MQQNNYEGSTWHSNSIPDARLNLNDICNNKSQPKETDMNRTQPSHYNNSNKHLSFLSKADVMKNYESRIKLILTNIEEKNLALIIKRSDIKVVFEYSNRLEFEEEILEPSIAKVACNIEHKQSAFEIISERLYYIE